MLLLRLPTNLDPEVAEASFLPIAEGVHKVVQPRALVEEETMYPTGPNRISSVVLEDRRRMFWSHVFPEGGLNFKSVV